jgi:hypothetical protein
MHSVDVLGTELVEALLSMLLRPARLEIGEKG